MTILDRSTRILLNSLPDHSVYHEVEMPPMDGRLTWREPGLSPQTAVKLYNATSFLTWRYGLHFNAHLNIGFGTMGLDDRAAAAAMSRFNKEAKRYLAVARAGRRLPDGRPRLGGAYHYVYVFEYGRQRGLHAHLLCVLPPGMKAAFARFAHRWWAGEADLIPSCSRCRYPEQPLATHQSLRPGTGPARDVCPGLEAVYRCTRHGADSIGCKMPEDAVKLVQPRPVCPSKAHELQYVWLRYILKTTQPGSYWSDVDGTPRYLEEVLHFALRPPRQPSENAEPMRICMPQMHGISQSLGTKAQEAFGFKSRLTAGSFELVYSGWELKSFQMRDTIRTLQLR